MTRCLPSLRGWITGLACVLAVCSVCAAKTLDLSGYTDASGAITVQHQGDTVDPYFALQALWLAQSQGMDTSAHALPFARWLAGQYSAAGHLGRYCKTAERWTWCKAPDADDASLALWLLLLRHLPEADRQHLNASAVEARAWQAFALPAVVAPHANGIAVRVKDDDLLRSLAGSGQTLE